MFHQITIDGVSGSGKTTLSQLLAKKLNFLNINTGIFFRGITYYKIQNNIESLDELIKGIKKDIQFHHNKILILNHDITRLLFDQKITNNVPKIAQIPEIRDFILILERNYANTANIVIEGRDTGSIVFPDAILKIFLNAKLETRAKRRLQQLSKNKDPKITLQAIQQTIETRDKEDEKRSVAPLIKPKGAIEIFTDTKSIDEIVDDVIAIYKKLTSKITQ